MDHQLPDGQAAAGEAEVLSSSKILSLQIPGMVLTYRVCRDEGPAEVVRELRVQPATGAAVHLLHCHHPVCPVLVNYT